MLVDACSLRCGFKLFEREGMSVDHYMELTSLLKIKKEKRLPPRELEEQVYQAMHTEVQHLLRS
jgi:uncharacterized metal-binding protein